MIEKLKLKIVSLSEIAEQMETDLSNTHALLYRIESNLHQNSYDKVEEYVAKLRQELTGRIQSNFFAMKSEIMVLNSLSFEKLFKQIESNQSLLESTLAKEEITHKVKNRIQEQNLLLKQFSLSYFQNNSNECSIKNTNSRINIQNKEEAIAEVLSFLAKNSNDKDVQKLCSHSPNRALSIEKALISSLRFKILESQNRAVSSGSKRQDSRGRSAQDQREFSVYSDFSFQTPMEENLEARKLATIKEDLTHVQLDEILRISSLPISIQSDEEYRNFEF
jgi:hypothetical protein